MTRSSSAPAKYEHLHKEKIYDFNQQLLPECVWQRLPTKKHILKMFASTENKENLSCLLCLTAALLFLITPAV